MDHSQRGPKVRDLTGEIFGRLTVTARAQSSPRGGTRWVCLCSCGKQTTVAANSLRRETTPTRSCGCLHDEVAAAWGERWITHGYARRGSARRPTYSSYKSAKRRCTNVNYAGFPGYGGRGIQFKFTSFAQFLAEVGDRPRGASLERIDNDGHYETGNVRWATPQQQCNNKRTNRLITAFGRTRTLAWWSRETGFAPAAIRHRLAAGWHPENALTQPTRRGKRSAAWHAWQRAVEVRL
jgi:hypothetical protein